MSHLPVRVGDVGDALDGCFEPSVGKVLVAQDHNEGPEGERVLRATMPTQDCLEVLKQPTHIHDMPEGLADTHLASSSKPDHGMCAWGHEHKWCMVCVACRPGRLDDQHMEASRPPLAV